MAKKISQLGARTPDGSEQVPNSASGDTYRSSAKDIAKTIRPSEFSAVSSFDGGEAILTEQSGVLRKATAAQIAARLNVPGLTEQATYPGSAASAIVWVDGALKRILLPTMLGPKSISATRNPAASDTASTASVQLGSMWINTAAVPRSVWVCTNPGVGTSDAEWAQVFPGTGGGTDPDPVTMSFDSDSSEFTFDSDSSFSWDMA